jgi:hypothetical protein
LDTELSDWERRQISWESLTKETLSVDLDTQNFPIEQDKDASNYWIWKRPNILTDRGQLLSASDLPLDVFDFADGMAGWQIDDLNGIETEETIAQLLNEAVALHEWTIPPNAFVEVSSDHLLVRR